MTLALIVFLPFLTAILPPLARPAGRSLCAFAAGVGPIASLVLALNHLDTVLSGGLVQQSWSWIPGLGMDLAFRLDGLSMMFVILILGIGLLVILYARYYLSAKENNGRFYALLLIFMGAMLGIVTADNLLMLIVFWEATSISSFLLIGFWSHKTDARKGARMALAITGGGGLALMAAVLLMGHVVGSYALGDVLAAGDQIRAHALYPLILVLFLLGVFTKSAQFPFHFWLPHAMAAPTPVSAYLHSATMVKAGIFLLARFYPALSGTELWFYIVTFTGATTLLVGAYIALFKHDIKALLAYSTISHLGLITFLFGLDTRLATVAAVFHIINHAIFKASLFMAAGIIDHETGTRDMRQINGLWRFMPHTTFLALVAASSMAGVPLLNGFLSKEMFFAETLESDLLGGFSWTLPVIATLAGVFSVAYSIRFAHDVFFNGRPNNLPKYPPHEPPRYMKIPVEILAALCLVVGVLPAWSIGPILASAAASTLGGALPDYSLAIVHGFNLPLLMSATALSGGLVVYLMRHKLFAIHDSWPEIDEKVIFDNAVRTLAGWSGRAIRLLENGSLQRYNLLLLLSVLAVGLTALWPMDFSSLWARDLAPVDPGTAVGAGILIVTSILTAAIHRRRLFALVALGTAGLMVALGFARFSAPDLAMTQLSVEVVTVVLLMLALFFLPQSSPAETPLLHRARDLAIAAASGIGMTFLTWTILTQPYSTIADFFLEQSVPAGGGTNVVNVILVDFRGFDTLGEITVLAIAALGVFAMLDGLKIRAPSRDYTGHRWSSDPFPIMLQQLSRPLLPMALLVAIFVLFRGHQLPGGGFIAGLITAVALILQYVANGVNWTQERMPVAYRPVIATGLTLAVGTGVGSWFFGAPFLTSWHGYVHIPLLGKTELATAMVFDIGVYLTVVGATLLILAKLGRLSTIDETGQEVS
ncbi:monovalent cation/H+ antiporter subunit A [Hydrocarboniclastica marina]|uniref:Monovalent cation/H+ antiporter subunit A n=1 Tax=Hydrocarboniclastica marina TaxID=2259620 RepID=A0A4P7XIW5_9ALTE|nr:monovalent cation/H+ antiporter subunit A [Hydrocarboniclastica marina]QCF26695.1 monovalent cation/H+ antiporter subunit A [Hydrocarboniclastica marina]